MRLITAILPLLVISILLSPPASAQHAEERCGYAPYIQSLEDRYPGYMEAVDRTFEEAKQRGQESRIQGRRTVYRIPVVVHVVHVTSNPAQNLADSIIEDQIRILNEDFRRMNIDAGNIRPEFSDIAGDAMIEFELQEVKRVGIPFFIIPGFNLYDDIKDSSAGGSDAVDPEHTLNIWVGELFPGLSLGYAYPPAGMPNWPPGAEASSPGVDGVVIEYRAFGSNNPASSFYEGQGFTIKGRTAVHEVGHYLGLRHIWGDGGCGEDDGINYTPAASENSQSSGCDPGKNTCDAGQTGDLPDMWENYMDYSEEPCQVAFTLEQIDLMRGVLEGPRVGLVDTGGVSCTTPVTGTITGPDEVTEETTANYSAPASGNEFSWSVTGGTVISGAGTNNITVEWGSAVSGQVCLTESDGNCTGNTECLDITISSACTAPATGNISGSEQAVVSSEESYSIPATNNTIEWSVTGGTISSGQGTSTVTILWGSGSSGQVCVTESDGACTGSTECRDVSLSTVSGIEEIALEKGLTVYPNPANDHFYVSSREVPVRIELLDVTGYVIHTIDSPQTVTSIDLSNMPVKTLLVKVSYRDGIALKKMIVQ
jgi:hypothetical protein